MAFSRMGLSSNTRNVNGMSTRPTCPGPKTKELSNSSKSEYNCGHSSFGAAPNYTRDSVRYLRYARSSLCVQSHSPFRCNHSCHPSSRSGGRGGGPCLAALEQPLGPYPDNAPVQATITCTNSPTTLSSQVTSYSHSNTCQHRTPSRR